MGEVSKRPTRFHNLQYTFQTLHGRGKIKGRLDSTTFNITRPFTGEVSKRPTRFQLPFAQPAITSPFMSEVSKRPTRFHNL